MRQSMSKAPTDPPKPCLLSLSLCLSVSLSLSLSLSFSLSFSLSVCLHVCHVKLHVQSRIDPHPSPSHDHVFMGMPKSKANAKPASGTSIGSPWTAWRRRPYLNSCDAPSVHIHHSFYYHIRLAIPIPLHIVNVTYP